MLAKEKVKLLLRKAAADVLHYSGVDRLLQNHTKPPWRILAYHRIVSPEEFSYPIEPGIYVTPQTFALHMQFLASHCKIVPIEQLAQQIVQKEEIPPRTIAITFDDGWRDTYTNALPILREHKAPASIFLSTALINTNDTLWTDRFAATITALRELPQYHKHLSALINDCTKIERTFCAQLIETLISPQPQFLKLLAEARSRLKSKPLDERKAILSSFFKLSKEFTTIKLERNFLTWEEVKTLHKNNITIGSHGHQHLNYDELTQTQLADDLSNSHQSIQAKDIPISPIFSYPYGRYNQATQTTLAEKQVRFALTTTPHSELDTTPILLGRITLHEDISNTIPLFASRIWAEELF